jgi:hypothetical protein
MKLFSVAMVFWVSAALPSAAQTRINGNQVIEGTINSCDDTGTSAAYACNLATAIGGYVTGSQYCFKAGTTSPGGATVNLNSLGPKAIRKYAGGALVDLEANDIVAGQRVCVIYDGTYMQLPSRGSSTNIMRSFGVTFDHGGSALTASATTARFITAPFACEIKSLDILVDAGTATFKLWRRASGTAIPTSVDSISTSGVSITSGTAAHITDLSDFISAPLPPVIAANDIVGLNLSSVTTATWARLQVNCQ